jgi:tetratricopeptide (TPR) repeat protein
MIFWGGDNVEIDYNDFGVCPNCRTVNLKEIDECRSCGSKQKMKSIQEASGSGSIGCLFSVVIFIIGIVVGGPIGAFIGFLIAGAIMGASDNGSKAKENRFKKEAVSLLEKQSIKQKQSIQTFQAQAKKDFDNGNYEGAIENYKSTIENGDTSTDTVIGLINSYYNQGNYREAIPLLVDLLKEFEDTSLKELLVRSYLELDELSHKEIDFLNYEKEQYPDKLRNQIILKLAKYFYHSNAENDFKSVDILKAAMNLEPENPKHLEALVKILKANGQSQEGIQYLEQFNDSLFTPELWDLYTKILFEIKDFSSRSIQVIGRYLVEKPEDIETQIRLGQIFIRNRQIDQAITVYQNALEIDPNNIKIMHQMALTYMMDNQITNAIKELQTIVKLPQFETYLSKPTINKLLGKCFMKTNMLKLALSQFLLSDREIETLDLLYELGEMFEQEQDLDNAKRCWEEIFAIDITYKDISQKIHIN